MLACYSSFLSALTPTKQHLLATAYYSFPSLWLYGIFQSSPHIPMYDKGIVDYVTVERERSLCLEDE